MKSACKTMAVANQKGGVGKTTSSINFAAALAKKAKKVLLIDSDPQGNATSGVGVNARNIEHHLYHTYVDSCPFDKAIISTPVKNLDIVPSNINLVAAEIELVQKDARESTLKNCLDGVKEGYDYILIDCPPSLGLLTINALTASDSVIIPMQCEYFAMEGLAQLVTTIRSVKKSFNTALFIEGLLLTMFDKRNKLTHQVAEELSKHFSKQLFKTVIPRNVRLSECPSHGQTVLDYDIRSTGAKAYIQLANEFFEKPEVDTVAKATGLGQGVGLLFGNDTEEEKYFECEIGKISPNKYQPRTYFDDEDLKELSESIRENGIIQPLIVTKSDKDGEYELIAGERRLRASRLAGLDTVPVVVMDVTKEDTLLELALIENVQRTDLNPIEEAEAYQKLIQRFGYTQEDTAKRVGKKRSTISNMLRLLNLPDFIKQDVVDGTLSEGHGRALLRLSDDIATMKEVRDLIIKKSLSVRQTEKIVRKATTSSTTRNSAGTSSKSSDHLPATYCKALINQLTNKLSSKVYINQNGTRGKLEIEYYSSDDLERLISLIMKEGIE